MSAEGHPMPGWVPIRWSWSGGQPTLDWCELGELRLTVPFFDRTVQTAQERSGVVRQTPADLLSQIPAVGPGAQPSGFIFHLSRCGSTLAARALAALPGNIVLSEPEVLDTVLRTRLILPATTDTMRIVWLQGLARAYGGPRFPEEQRFFIKFDTWHLLFFDLIRQAFPGVPWIFLYRDPVEILVSQMTELSARMQPGPLSATLLGMPLLEALQTPPDEFYARALGRVASAGLDAVTRDPLGRLVNYSELPAALETIVASWLGVALHDADREKMRNTARFHAKSPDRPFITDTLAKQRLATDGLRNLAREWLSPTYTRLEEIRWTQAASNAGGAI